MKNLSTLICAIIFFSTSPLLMAQNQIDSSNDIPSNYLERSPIYDYSELNLNNTDSIPDFQSKDNKVMITGIIYQSDGVTPAEGVILYISQPNENGDYELKKENGKRYVHHRGWVKTDADGRYKFYTFIPGNFLRNRELKHIHPIIKEPGKPEYELNAFLFDNDPFLSKSCRKRLAKKGIDSILMLEETDAMFIATKDIILEENLSSYNK